MLVLNKKLLRDLLRLRGQVLAIALVIGSGAALLIMSLTTLESLQETADAYYERYRFAHVFASMKRAPERLARRIAEIPGVQAVETRITKFATLDIDGFEEPVIGQLVSVPEGGMPRLNRLALRAGRIVAPNRRDEVVISEAFAEEHNFEPGDRLKAVINGNKRKLRIVGIALSPEFVYAIAPGALMPDDRRYGILWMGREALAAAYDLDGAFNDVSLSLLRGASPEAVIERLDRLTERYGGVGAIARADQVSNWFLVNEFAQLRNMSTIMPTIFLTVAAFLSNMVLARLISTERSEIGLLKAFGYSNAEVAWHYVKMVMAMAALGVLIGSVAGVWLGRLNTSAYTEFFQFPFLYYRPGPQAFVLAGLVCLAATLVGALGAVRRAAMLPPAEAMRPPAPPIYRRSGLGRTVIGRWLDQPTRIVLRYLVRRPGRSAVSSLGIALAIGVLIMAFQWIDSINHLVEVQFNEAQRQDLSVGLVEAQSSAVLHDFRHLPGVLSAEAMRIVSADLSVGTRTHRGALTGIPPDARLQPIYDVSGKIIAVPPAGLVLGTKLAEKLDVSVGDRVRAKVLEGRRPEVELPVAGLFETYIGTPAYMDLSALNRLQRERPSLEYVNLVIDEAEKPALFAKLKELPKVSAVLVKQAAIDNFHETMGEMLMIFVSFFIGFASTLAFGVVYNSARISLSERGRELATLRVLGFTRAEISYILLAEIGFLAFLALPLGCLSGAGLAWLMTSAFETELYRVPLVIGDATFGKAVVIVLGVTAASAGLVRRRLDRLDLIAVLKTRE